MWALEDLDLLRGVGKSQCIWFWCLVWVTCSTPGGCPLPEESDSHSPSFTHRYIISEAGRGSRGQLRTACDLTNRETESQCEKGQTPKSFSREAGV